VLEGDVLARHHHALDEQAYQPLPALEVERVACSGARRAPIPGQGEQGFRSKVSSRSGDAEQAFRACRAPIPGMPSRHSGEAEHPR